MGLKIKAADLNDNIFLLHIKNQQTKEIPKEITTEQNTLK